MTTSDDPDSGQDGVEDVPEPDERSRPDDHDGDEDGRGGDDTTVDGEEWVDEEHEGPDGRESE